MTHTYELRKFEDDGSIKTVLKISGEPKDTKREAKRFETNMGEIVNHYILDAIGGEMDMSTQLPYILEELQSNKEVIMEDIRSGA